ncbi:MAG: type pilus assembly ATPase PilB, type pilus assembly protein PilB [Candidatus Parcubacteria bacterium]|jgi:type IV pilus assembly protein PilB
MPQFHDQSSLAKLSDLRKRGEEQLLQALAPQYGIPYIDLHGITLNPEALTKISEQKARANKIVAFGLLRKEILLATVSPQAEATMGVVQELEKLGYTTKLHLCSEASLEHGFARYADQRLTTASKKGVLDINPEDIMKLAHTITTVADVHAAVSQVGTVNSPRRISETLELMFAGALALKASDIHIEPAELGIRLRYRLDGVLIDITDIDAHLYGRLMSRLKLLAGMTLNERKEAQDGRFQFVFGQREIEVRASIIPGASGESMVMRLLDPGVASFSIEKLQLNPYLATVMERELKRPNGLIITTGPTGSGKTTALYAFLRAVHDSEKKIITIENPVEYKLPGIVQTQIGPDYSFASGLRAILRQDPDIIMVGEIRDREVAETAIHAAQTGHLVFSTLHTNSAAGGFPRLIDLGVDSRIIGSSVNVLLGQRLVRILCPHCKTAYTITPTERDRVIAILKNYPETIEVKEDTVLYKSVGCEKCGGTGFNGRVGVFEAIVIDEAVEEIVIRDPREHMILEAAAAQKIPSMAEDGMIKVLAGVTTIAELERVVDLNYSTRRDTTQSADSEEEIDISKYIV